MFKCNFTLKILNGLQIFKRQKLNFRVFLFEFSWGQVEKSRINMVWIEDTNRISFFYGTHFAQALYAVLTIQYNTMVGRENISAVRVRFRMEQTKTITK